MRMMRLAMSHREMRNPKFETSGDFSSSTQRKGDALRPSASAPDLRPSTSAPMSSDNRAGGMYTSQPPRSLLFSRGAQFRVSALDKREPKSSETRQQPNGSECQRCIDYRQQIKGLKRRLDSVRYADDRSVTRDPAVEKLDAENDGLKACILELRQKLEEQNSRAGTEINIFRQREDLENSYALAEKEAHIEEMKQIIINRDESIELCKQEHLRMEASLQDANKRQRKAESQAAAATAALKDAQSKLGAYEVRNGRMRTKCAKWQPSGMRETLTVFAFLMDLVNR